MKQLIARVSGKCADTDHVGGGILVGVGADRLYIATARHVVWCGAKQEGAKGIQVELRSMPGEPMGAKLLSRANPSLDLAVLVVSGIRGLGVPVEAIPFDRLGDSKVLRRGHALYFVGHPAGRFWETNIVPDRLSDKRGDDLRFQSSGISVGVSGGGLFDERQKLVGMIVHDLPPESEAIAIEKVLEEIRLWGYPVSLQYKHVLRDISGEWLSEEIKGEKRYLFSFEMQGTRVFGSVTRLGEKGVRGILDGMVENDIISFRVRNRKPGSFDSYSDTEFHGKIAGERISFIRQTDTGEPLTRFVATSRGGTQLHKAITKGETENIKGILDSGVDIDASDTFGDTALHYAIRKRLQALTQDEPKEKADKWLGIVTLLVEEGADANKADSMDDTPLGMVLSPEFIDLKTAKILLAHGADPNQRVRGLTFLHRAACKGQADVAEALISAGADVDVFFDRVYCGKREATALFLAVDKKKQDIVRLLLQAGANANTASGYYTALHTAVYDDNEDMVKMLLRAGADIDSASGYDEKTPVLMALSSRRTDTIAKLLIDAGADITKKDKYGWGVLHAAAARDKATDLLRRLIASGASIGDRLKNGRTVLHIAAYAGKAENVEFLLELGADVNARDKNGNTPLHDAIYKSWMSTEVVDLLLEAGADVNAANKEGNTPLHLVARTSTKKDVKETGFFPIAEILIGKGANLNAKNKKYETPLDIATEQKSEIAKVFQGHGDNSAKGTGKE